MHKLSISVIAKNEHLYLEEWVNYHRAVGVEHFYIYDNESAIPITQTLSKYIAAGCVDVINYPGPSRQMPSFDHCLRNFGKDNQWIAFVDCDEFLVPKKTDYVTDILDQFANYGALQVNWVLFGSNGWKERPNGMVIENYTLATNSDWNDNLHTKAIVQPQFTKGPGGNPHHFIYLHNHHAVDEQYRSVPNAWNTAHSVEKIQLNHYTNKSLEDLKDRKSKGRADGAHLPTKTLQNFEELDKASTVKETSILRFIDKTKALYL